MVMCIDTQKTYTIGLNLELDLKLVQLKMIIQFISIRYVLLHL
jgi:hypothetical protein